MLSPHSLKSELSDLLRNDFLKDELPKRAYKRREHLYQALQMGREEIENKLSKASIELKERESFLAKYSRPLTLFCAGAGIASFAIDYNHATPLFFTGAAAFYIISSLFPRDKNIRKTIASCKDMLKALDNSSKRLLEIKEELVNLKEKYRKGKVTSINSPRIAKEIKVIDRYFENTYAYLTDEMDS